MHCSTVLPLLLTVLSLSTSALPITNDISSESLQERQVITTPFVTVDGSPLDQAAGGFAEFSPIEDGFLEGDNDSGGESETGNTAVSVANGLTGVGSGSASNSNGSSTSTSSSCSATSCSSGAGAANQNNTSTSTSSSSVTFLNAPLTNGPVTNGPLVTVGKLNRRAFRFKLLS